MRSFNEGWALRETLPALQSQEYRNWELIVFDSGSTDGSVELLRRAQPRHLVQIRPEEYNPSRVMNRGMELAGSEFCIFLNADATPQGGNWLRPLVQALQDPAAAAVFGRQIPRPDCQAVYAHDYERCFGPGRESGRWEHYFSMVSSGLRKDIWARRGFLTALQYSEDDEYSRWCLAQGYRVVYCPESVVMHSHNYTAAQAYKRYFGEARALAAVWTGNPGSFNWPRTVVAGWLNDLRRDAAFCARHRRIDELPHAARIRWQQRRGKLDGFRAGWDFYRQQSPPPISGLSSEAGQRPPRFTLDGSAALEERLEDLCRKIVAGVQAIIPARRLDAVVLGGGYGRGQGGVLRTEDGERPYNDLEFYVLTRGNRLLNERRFGRALEQLGEEFSPKAGLHVEFKIDSWTRLRRSPVTMFSYDLASGHRTFLGREEIWQECRHHLRAEQIPPAEATRLLLNRCSGLLFAKERLSRPSSTGEDWDFIGRNLAKARLAFGDAVLAAMAQYHWDCRERHRRLARWTEWAPADSQLSAFIPQVVRWHAEGLEFKLHPHRMQPDLAAARGQCRELAQLARQLWLWLEGRRLGRTFASTRDYAAAPQVKWPDSPAWRNGLVNLRNFGPGGLLDSMAWRYPRERLLNALGLLLWEEEAAGWATQARFLRRQLRAPASGWSGWVAAYERVWRRL